MKLNIVYDNNEIHTYDITKDNYKLNSLKKKLGFINSQSKEYNALNIIQAYYSDSKVVLFDNTNQILSSKIDDLNIKEFPNDLADETIFKSYDFSMLFFTSGTTGNPVGALKTKQNLEDEVKVFSSLIKKYNIKRVILTVPFIHIYGTLVGLLYPLLNDIDIVLKEHFLPHNLLEMIDGNSLVVTTPLYLKALNSISDTKDLSSSLFVSSTAPLDQEIATNFIDKFNTNLIQLFGSTETGGIAYRFNNDELWTPLEKVEILTNEENELKIKSPFVSNILYENGFQNIDGTIQTFDYIEKYDNKFKLVGRSSKILKIAGKRYSTVQIENILEDVDEIQKAIVFVNRDEKSLRGEVLDITIQSDIEFTATQIKKILKAKLSNLKFLINLHIVDEIVTNQIGKKLQIK